MLIFQGIIKKRYHILTITTLTHIYTRVVGLVDTTRVFLRQLSILTGFRQKGIVKYIIKLIQFNYSLSGKYVL